MNAILRILFLIGCFYFILRAGVGIIQAHDISCHWTPIQGVLVDRQTKALRFQPRWSSRDGYTSTFLKPVFAIEEDYRVMLHEVSTPVVAYASFSYFPGMAAWQKSRRDKELPIGSSAILRFGPHTFGDVSVYSNGWQAFKGLVLDQAAGAAVCLLFFWLVSPGKYEADYNDSFVMGRNLWVDSADAIKVMPWVGFLLLILLGIAVHSLWIDHRLHKLEAELLNVNEPTPSLR